MMTHTQLLEAKASKVVQVEKGTEEALDRTRGRSRGREPVPGVSGSGEANGKEALSLDSTSIGLSPLLQEAYAFPWISTYQPLADISDLAWSTVGFQNQTIFQSTLFSVHKGLDRMWLNPSQYLYISFVFISLYLFLYHVRLLVFCVFIKLVFEDESSLSTKHDKQFNEIRIS